MCKVTELAKEYGWEHTEAALKSMTSTCGKKILLTESADKFIKIIPYIGCLVGIIFGALELWRGNYVLGITTIASGICSIFPGWFQVASFCSGFGGFAYQIAKIE